MSAQPDDHGIGMGMATESTADTELVRHARAWLSRAVEPGQALMHGYVETVGPIAAMRALRSARAPAPVQALVGARFDEDQLSEDLAAAARSEPGSWSPATLSGPRSRCMR